MTQDARGVRGAGEGSKGVHVQVPSQLDAFIVRGAGEEIKELHVQNPPQRPYVYPSVAAGSRGAIIRSYKASVSFRVNAMRGITHPPIWLCNYYEHIIRDYKEYSEIWKYVQENPRRWIDDKFFLFPPS